MREARTMASWVLALFLAAMFLWIADQSLFPAEGKNVVFPLLAERSEYYLFEPTGRYVVSLLEVLAALLILIPPTRRIGALLAILIAAGAVGLHLSPWLGTEIPASSDALAGAPGATDGGQLFYLSIGLLVASLLLFFIHPGRTDAPARGLGYYGR
jgi:uncharacterized membrane protein YphA (DoxX/SURF4 family)